MVQKYVFVKKKWWQTEKKHSQALLLIEVCRLQGPRVVWGRHVHVPAGERSLARPVYVLSQPWTQTFTIFTGYRHSLSSGSCIF